MIFNKALNSLKLSVQKEETQQKEAQSAAKNVRIESKQDRSQYQEQEEHLLIDKPIRFKRKVRRRDERNVTKRIHKDEFVRQGRRSNANSEQWHHDKYMLNSDNKGKILVLNPTNDKTVDTSEKDNSGKILVLKK